MTKQLKLILLIVSLTCVPFLMNGQGKRKGYDFPVKPGSDEWKQLKTYAERLNVYNLPDSVLKTISTEDLVQTCINYPEIGLIMTRNSMQDGYDYLKKIFNGFVELEKRKDAGKELLSVYQNTDPSEVRKMSTPLERGAYSHKIMYLEMMMAQQGVIVNMTDSDRQALLVRSTAVYDTIVSLPKNYGYRAHTCPALIMGRVLKANQLQGFLKKKETDTELNEFVERSGLPRPEVVDYIVSEARSQAKKVTK